MIRKAISTEQSKVTEIDLVHDWIVAVQGMWNRSYWYWLMQLQSVWSQRWSGSECGWKWRENIKDRVGVDTWGECEWVIIMRVRCCTRHGPVGQWKRAQIELWGMRSSTLAGCSHGAIPFLASDWPRVFLDFFYLNRRCAKSLFLHNFHALSGIFWKYFGHVLELFWNCFGIILFNFCFTLVYFGFLLIFLW